ncbi:MAG: flagellar protein FlaG [Gammaproteobacteria bacterium]|nr:flagellar protein FlaG [Gammaproteobacteria bacterium]
MSSDIMSNHSMKTATVNAAQSVAINTPGNEKRQTLAAATGTDLPPATEQVQESAQKESLQQTQQASQQVSKEKAREVVEQLNNHAQFVNRDLHFSVDDDSGRTVIKVVNSETAELIRQIPSEEVLKLSETIRESVDSETGFIVQTSA